MLSRTTARLIVELIENEDYAQAHQLANRLVERNSDDWVAHSTILDLYYRQKLYRQCVEHAKSIESSIPISVKYLVPLCYSLCNLKQYSDVLAIGQQHSQEVAGSRELIHVVALALYSLGKYEDAIAHIEVSLGITSGSHLLESEIAYIFAASLYATSQFLECLEVIESLVPPDELKERFDELKSRCYRELGE